jgi:hypothetical protein
MASKTVPVTPTADDSPKPPLTTVKKSTYPTLSLSGTIGYQLSATDRGEILIGLTSNSGNGYFSKARQSANHCLDILADWEKQYPITSLALKDLYPDTSINSWGFLLAVLIKEGVVEKDPENGRHYRLCDPALFQAEMAKLVTAHSKPGKAKSKTKTKAASRM